MTLEELKLQLPDRYSAWVAQYGPAFIAMTAEELKAWIERVLAGDTFEAYKAVLAKLTNADSAAAGQALILAWDKANKANAESMNLQKNALFGILGILLKIALTLVGL